MVRQGSKPRSVGDFLEHDTSELKCDPRSVIPGVVEPVIRRAGFSPVFLFFILPEAG